MLEIRNKEGLTEKEFLQQYNPGDYERPSVTVDTILFALNEKMDSLKILLVKRKDHPFINCWAFPGGFVDIKESSHEAAIRELKEETGLDNVYVEQLYTYTNPKRDPRMRIIDIAYFALLDHIPNVSGHDDASDAAWFDVSLKDDKLKIISIEKNVRIEYDLTKTNYKHGKIEVSGYVEPVLQSNSNSKLAFDHTEILVDCILRIRNKIEYTDLIFNLMPDRFTLTDLQRVYELVLDKSLYKKNFRVTISDCVEPTDDKMIPVTSLGTKPAVLYKYSKNN